MKKLIYSTLGLAVAASMFLTSCKDDSNGGGTPTPEVPKPTITFETSSGYVFAATSQLVNTNVKIGIAVTHTINLKKLKITRNYNGGGEVILLDSTISGNTKTASKTLNNILGANKGTYTYTISCTDNDATTATKTIVVTAQGPLLDRGIDSVFSIKSATGLSAYDLLLGEKITASSSATNQAQRDIVDGSSNTTGALTGVWNSQNGTRYKIGSAQKINGKTFNQFTTEQDILDAWNAASAETSTVTVDIANKNILIAKVVRGAATNYILISITDLNDVTGSNNDFIEFQYKL